MPTNSIDLALSVVGDVAQLGGVLKVVDHPEGDLKDVGHPGGVLVDVALPGRVPTTETPLLDNSNITSPLTKIVGLLTLIDPLKLLIINPLCPQHTLMFNPVMATSHHDLVEAANNLLDSNIQYKTPIIKSIMVAYQHVLAELASPRPARDVLHKTQILLKGKIRIIEWVV